MSASPVIEELQLLLARTIDGHPEEGDARRINELLDAHAEARQFYHDFLDLHTDLQWLLSPDTLQLPSGLESLTSRGKRAAQGRRFSRLATALGIAAAITLAFIFLRPQTPPVLVQDPPPQFVARITLDEDAGWTSRSTIHRDDAWLGEGTVRLDSGRLGITFNTGARLVLDAPAELDINGVDRAFLRSGEISAQVPPQAIGFLVSTPNGNILDLGTEFRVAVDSGRSQVEVTEGMVKAYATGAKGEEVVQVVNEDEAVAMAGDPHRPIEALAAVGNRGDIDWSQLQIPDFLYVHYGFEETDGQFASAGNRTRKFPGTAGNHWGDKGRPNSTRGRFGQALSFSGDGGCVTTPYPGIGGGRPRTVAFWIKLAPDVRGPSGQAVVSWGAAQPGKRWQIGWNNNHGWGTIGALRTDFFGGFVTGTTDLRDGRWHHVVSVFIGGRKPDVASHVLHYVDGRLEGVSGRKSKLIDTRVRQPESSTLLLGAQLNDGSHRVAFKGSLDELYIFDAALLPEQIVQLNDANRTVGADPAQQ